MTKMKTFKCDCGQVTELVEVNGVLCFNEKRHGNGEPANCKCFNCGKVNAELAAEVKAAQDQADAEAEKERLARLAEAKKAEKAAKKNNNGGNPQNATQ
jgi:hypothetical protein